MENKDIMEKISTLSILALPFSVIISVCYLVGYWGTFDIDIFSYLTASDLVVLSSIPWIGIGVASLVGLGIGKAFHQFEESTIESKDGKIIAMRKAIKISDKVFLVVIAIVMFFGGPEKWLVLPALFALLVTAVIFMSGIIETNRASLKKQLLLTLLVTFLPFQAFGYGKNKSLRIEQGSSYRFLAKNIEGIEVPRIEDIRYLGKAGGYVFLFNASNKEVVIIMADSINPLVIQSSKNIEKIEQTSSSKK